MAETKTKKPEERVPKIKLGFEKFTQDSDEHLKGYFVALNNRFPNLSAWGLVQYLKQMMAVNPSAKVLWSDESIKAMCAQMNFEEELLREIVEYCIKTLKIFKITHSWRDFEVIDEKYIVYPDFMQELIYLQIKKLQQDAEVERNQQLDDIEKNYETAFQRKKRMIADIREVLVLTDEIKKNVGMFYPGLGDTGELWKSFVDKCCHGFLEWHAILTKENYENNFYVYLNNLKPIEMPKDNG